MADTLDRVFSALADPTRRKIIELVKEREYTVGEIGALFEMSLPAVSKHLKVLDDANLLNRARNGKYRLCRYNPEPCREAMKWINDQHQFWNESLDALGDFLDKVK
jgi:DNA-binding transcriptional ArsR family regulator